MPKGQPKHSEMVVDGEPPSKETLLRALAYIRRSRDERKAKKDAQDA